MDIKRSGSQPSARGPAEYFTGMIRIDPLFEAHESSRALGASVTFESGQLDGKAFDWMEKVSDAQYQS